jgi:hypothetical protein
VTADDPLMTPPPIIPNAQAKKDDEHLRLLSVFHFVFAGLALLGIGFLCLQIPFGTALGVFTLMVLMRDSVRESYETPRAFP